ncbi:DNA segregation ATPase FtsK/SpoIIIE, S-DNA-T family [Pustulibacterium marinum]|uniref:DNA segregation ATPase FtsK/SpoIIIE, S-DNA-T family n=1 Tax=Pustulibacterium marinum TaxID=1224947 RepID=A0A1I7INI1_9FLAO|nr:DNA translocase FtsK [Pustulibacterium marinum]SFU74459.1 DNA segregation ATPase FtsK/SpoIIIE, S-DNA-T family [Pustulibacterium marinum]
MAKTKSKKTTTTSKFKIPALALSRPYKIIVGSLLMLFSVALFISFISYFFTWKQDQSEIEQFANRAAQTQNLLKKFGASVSDFFIYDGFGIAAFIFAYLFFVTGLALFFNSNKKAIGSKWLWGVLSATWLAILFGFFIEKAPLLGGTIGFEMNSFLQDYVGKIGVILILVFGLIFYLTIKVRLTPEQFVDFYIKKRDAYKEAAALKKQSADESLENDQDDLQSNDETTVATSNLEEIHTESEEEPTFKKSSFEMAIENSTPTIKNHSTISKDDDVAIENSFEVKVAEEEASTETSAIELDKGSNLPPTPPKEEKEDTDLEMEVETTEEEEVTDNLADKIVKDFGEFDPTLDLSNYKFPILELLAEHGKGSSITINQEELEENKNTIVNTLKNYKIEIAQIKATIGPTVTLYEIVPEAGIRISKIKNLEDDIALSLAALGIRIIAPIPGKGTIGIEVPNKNPSMVSMRSVIAAQRFQTAEMELPIAFGKNISNETFVVDLAKMPHLLMAGATGQGKSVGLNAILTSLLYKKHPAEVKFVLVDPKKVELTLFNKIERHFLAKLPDSEEAIITDNTKVINTLNSLCIEMDNRYELLKNAMVRNIKEYNAKFKSRKLNPNDGHKFLPYIVLVVDEFADLIMTAGKEVETPIARLAQLARAIGIHLIIATQRPSVNVITGIIKANFPARVAFRVTSKIDSRTILDSPGADQLIGKGDMLYTQGNALTRLQCAFVDTPEVEKITEFIGSQRAYPEAHLLPEYVGEDEGSSPLDVDIADRDKLFKDAAEVIVTAQQGSASLLQRKLKLGYNRAGRLIDQLEAAGIVGPFEGSKARQVLVPDLLALEQLLENEKNN